MEQRNESFDDVVLYNSAVELRDIFKEMEINGHIAKEVSGFQSLTSIHKYRKKGERIFKITIKIEELHV